MAQHLRSPHAMSSRFAFIWHWTTHCPGTGLRGLPPITGPSRRVTSYQQPRYRRHSSCGHWDTQAPQPIQNGDTNTGIPCCAVHTFTYPHRRDTFFCVFKSRSNSAQIVFISHLLLHLPLAAIFAPFNQACRPSYLSLVFVPNKLLVFPSTPVNHQPSTPNWSRSAGRAYLICHPK